MTKIHIIYSKSIEGVQKGMIYQQAFHAAKISHVVNMVSTSYVQVSRKHVMSRIAGKLCIGVSETHRE